MSFGKLEFGSCIFSSFFFHKLDHNTALNVCPLEKVIGLSGEENIKPNFFFEKISSNYCNNSGEFQKGWKVDVFQKIVLN